MDFLHVQFAQLGIDVLRTSAYFGADDAGKRSVLSSLLWDMIMDVEPELASNIVEALMELHIRHFERL